MDGHSVQAYFARRIRLDAWAWFKDGLFCGWPGVVTSTDSDAQATLAAGTMVYARIPSAYDSYKTSLCNHKMLDTSLEGPKFCVV